MYSMLIVDDEEITRTGLCSMSLWKDMGIRVVGSAANGEEALEMMERLPVQILLTDVKMPCMDGLALTGRVRERYPHVRIVFVSGYDDVSYVRQALRMSAVDYILKPVETSELTQCFKRVVQALDQEQGRMGELKQLLDAYKTGMTFMQENLLGIMLNNPGVSETQLRQVAQALHAGHEESRYFVFVIHVRLTGDESMHALLGDCEDMYCFSVNQSAGIYALVFVSTQALSRQQQYVLSLRVREKLYPQKADRFSGVYASRQCGIWDIRAEYRKVLRSLPGCFYLPDGALMSCDEFAQQPKQMIPLPECSADLLETLFLSGQEKEADHFLQAYFDALRGLRLLNAGAYIEFFTPLLHALDDLLRRRFTILEDDEMHLSARLGALVDAFCLDDMFETVRIHYCSVRSMLIFHSAGETSAHVVRVKRYVQTHFAQSLSLEQLAREVSLAPTYLCLLFREETGQTLTAYITDVRMERAKELLVDVRMKLYDVSMAVGYPNPSYFTRQFRKYTGMTPTEYRNRCTKGE